VLQYQVASFLGENQRTACAESYEKRCVGFLKVWEPAAILVFDGGREVGGHETTSTGFGFLVCDG
jgi:hypothetical protein